MRRYRLILIMSIMICFEFFMGGAGVAFADEEGLGNRPENRAETPENDTVPQEASEGNVSGNDAPEGTVSEDTVSQDSIPVEDVSSIEITDIFADDEDGTVLIQACISCTGSSFIRCVEAANAKAGIRKALFESDGETEEKSLTVRLRTKAGGTYVFYACDTKGNIDSGEIRVSGHHRGSVSSYSEKAKANAAAAAGGSISLINAGPRIYGGADETAPEPVSSGQGYSVKSKDKAANEEPSYKEKYGQWSLLKEKEKKDDARAWYEPEVEGNEEAVIDPGSELQDLSDYGVDIFRSSIKRPSGGTAEKEHKAGAALPDLNFERPDANIGAMKNTDPLIITGIIIFIIIILMAVSALLLLKSGKNGTKGKKEKSGMRGKKMIKPEKNSRVVRSSTSSSKKKQSPKPSVSAKKPQGRMPALKAPGAAGSLGDDGIEKYALMTEDYIRTRFKTELRRVGLKKYYSERHGFDCVDFTYRPSTGVLPSEFRYHLNDVDTALSNVSGADTVTFAVDNDTGTYRTTFYKV